MPCPFQPRDVIATGTLHALIGMMDQLGISFHVDDCQWLAMLSADNASSARNDPPAPNQPRAG